MSKGDFGISSNNYGAVYHRSSAVRDKDNFNGLCDTVSGKIFVINKNISKLENISRTIDVIDKENEKKIHNLSQDTNKLANETKECFQNISEYTRAGRFEHLDHRQQQYNLLQDKLVREFENSLSRYHAIQNVLSLKMKEVIEKEVSVNKDTSTLIDISTNEGGFDDDDDDEELLIDHQQERTQQILQHEEELEQVRDRNQRIQQIEEDILNVNEIFRDLATIVHEQGETIDSIESHVELASVQVHEGNKQLQRAKNYQKSARKRLCCILGVSLVAAIILILIIYYSVK
ncbi:syntaxin-7-like isoform X2 [Clytia hemisphaerica]|uniref:t-SNARE coiled-coil homology domain-containing protein n=1 Tax=Clytia hemisphaerica TaxID=252671 RepID=A0A7M5WJP7_9CNID